MQLAVYTYTLNLFSTSIFVYDRESFTQLSFVVKKYVPHTDAIKDIVRYLVSGGIFLHEFQKHDFYRGKKEVLWTKSIETFQTEKIFKYLFCNFL